VFIVQVKHAIELYWLCIHCDIENGMLNSIFP